MQPLPTPYDIPHIPFFAYVPPWSAWIALGAGAVSVLILYYLAPKLSLPRSKVRAFNLAKSELERIKSRGQVSKELLERAGSVVKILIATIGGRDSPVGKVRELGPSELESLARKESSERLKELLFDLKEMSLLTYQKEEELTARDAEIFGRLLDHLRNYEEEWMLVARGAK